MSTLLRAEDEPVATRVDRWRSVVSDAVGPMDLRFASPDITDVLITQEIGAVRVTESSSGAGEARRTAQHIRRSGPPSYQLYLQVRGRAVGEQYGRQTILEPGQLALVDFSHPLRCMYTERKSVIVSFPQSLAPLRPQEMARLTKTPISGDRGAGALVASMVRQLPRQLADDDVDRSRLGTAVLDLLTVALAARLDRAGDVPYETRQQALMTRIHAFIDAQLGDPDLSPTTIADAHHISIRYLHRLFEPDGQTVAEWIRQRRLSRCRRDLLDPSLAHRPVYATATQWGFPNAAHFSRLFRDTYGMPPGAFRGLHVRERPVSHQHLS